MAKRLEAKAQLFSKLVSLNSMLNPPPDFSLPCSDLILYAMPEVEFRVENIQVLDLDVQTSY